MWNGLINVSLSIASVVQTVSIDAILLLGSAISLQPKSIKPGHLLLPNTVIQHDICLNTRNKAIFRTNCKLSSWLRTLIAKGSGKENESLPTMYRGTLLSGSEIIKSETRITHLANTLNSKTPNEQQQQSQQPKDGDIDEEFEEEDENGDINDKQENNDEQTNEDDNNNNDNEDEENEPSTDGDDKSESQSTIYYDDAMAVDRESIAVAIICRQLRIPFCVLKSIAPPRFNINANFEDLYENDDVFDCSGLDL